MRKDRNHERSYGDGRRNHSDLDKNLSAVVERSAARVGERVAKALEDLKVKKHA